MPIQFPSNPSTGQTYTYNSITWNYDGVSWAKSTTGSAATVTVGNSAPVSPSDGALWLNNETSDVAVYFNGGWSAIVGPAGPEGAIGATGPGGINGGVTWANVQTANFTANVGTGYPVDTTTGAITVTLPASPARGDTIALLDYAGNFYANSLTISNNGNKINGYLFPGNLSLINSSVELVYLDSVQGWKSYIYSDTNLSLIGLIPNGQQAYTSPGTYTWIAPAGVTSVSVVLVGGGGGGGSTGDAGSSTAFGVTALGGKGGTPGTTQSTYGSGADAGFIGGAAGIDATGAGYSGGGGAAGYSGNGGNGGNSTSGIGSSGSGGGGAGGNAPSSSGGGVGILGQGYNGIGNGGGGSGGANGSTGSGAAGGSYGGGAAPVVSASFAGGGGCLAYKNNISVNPGASYTIVVGAGRGSGASGAVRIIWGTVNGSRYFPSTNTGNL